MGTRYQLWLLAVAVWLAEGTLVVGSLEKAQFLVLATTMFASMLAAR